MIAEDRNDPKTKEEAAQDVSYNVFLWSMHKRLYNRAVLVITVIELGLGSAAIYSAFDLKNASAIGTGAIGIVLAFITIVNHAWGPTKKSVESDLALRRYTALRAQCHTLEVEELYSRMVAVGADDPDVIEALRPVAYNCLAESLSKPSFCYELTPFQRLMRLLA